MSVTKHLKAISILMVYVLAPSCGNGDPDPVKSRDIRVEVTGNFVGLVSATYMNATGAGTYESITSLPWNKSITYASAVPSMAISVGATGGAAGQTIRIKVFAGGTLVSDTPGVADNSGMVAVTSPTYIF